MPDVSVDLVVNAIEGLSSSFYFFQVFLFTVIHGYSYTVLFILSDCKKPIVAAVEGLALGGGLELAMVCSFLS